MAKNVVTKVADGCAVTFGLSICFCLLIPLIFGAFHLFDNYSFLNMGPLIYCLQIVLFGIVMIIIGSLIYVFNQEEPKGTDPEHKRIKANKKKRTTKR